MQISESTSEVYAGGGNFVKNIHEQRRGSPTVSRNNSAATQVGISRMPKNQCLFTGIV
jgi:hypothetical protein